jgi:hypothetical protein
MRSKNLPTTMNA